MTLFWIVAIVMMAIAVAVIIIPILRPATVIVDDAPQRDQLNTRVIRERLAELDSERQSGRLDDQQYQQLRTELERTLLSDITDEQPVTDRDQGLVRALIVLVALVIPALAVSYYYLSSYRGEAGQWIALKQRLNQEVSEILTHDRLPPTESVEQLAGFIRVLQARLLAEGMDDPHGLYLLGVGYIQLMQPEAALFSLDRAQALAPDNTAIKLAIAQSNMMLNEGSLDQDSARLLLEVLRAEPANQGALMLLGFGAFNSGAYQQAIVAWQSLLDLQGPDSDSAELLRNSIAAARQKLVEAETATDTTPVAGPAIEVTVELAPELQARLSPDDTLFIFARAAEGPPMPLAAVRQGIGTFPVRVTLDDSQAMIASRKLSDFEQVVIGARISKTSNPISQSGDFEAEPVALTLADGSQPVSVRIDRVVQ